MCKRSLDIESLKYANMARRLISGHHCKDATRASRLPATTRAPSLVPSELYGLNVTFDTDEVKMER